MRGRLSNTAVADVGVTSATAGVEGGDDEFQSQIAAAGALTDKVGHCSRPLAVIGDSLSASWHARAVIQLSKF